MKSLQPLQHCLRTSILLLTMILMQPAILWAADNNKSSQSKQTEPAQHYTCSELGTLIINQHKHCTQSLRSLKRDMAALQQKMDQPGIEDITAGIGYILGIFGTAAFVASRRKQTKTHQ